MCALARVNRSTCSLDCHEKVSAVHWKFFTVSQVELINSLYFPLLKTGTDLNRAQFSGSQHVHIGQQSQRVWARAKASLLAATIIFDVGLHGL